MNRRDTIIIAVLVNAGLLMVLFATATRSGEKAEKPEKRVELAKELPTKKVEKKLIPEPEPESFDDFLAAAFSEETEEIVLEDLLEPEPVVQPVVAAPKVVNSSTETTIKVTVKSGDSLEKIARNNQTTVAAIMKANNISSTNLRVGQVLNIPVKEKAPEKFGEVAVASAGQTTGEFYVVKEGDSPWLIASKNRVKLEDLLRLNGLDEQRARRLRPGDKLRIR